MKKLIIVLAVLLASCSQKHFPQVYQQKGIIRQTDKGYYFYPIGEWQDYTPNNDGDTVTRYSLIKPKE